MIFGIHCIHIRIPPSWKHLYANRSLYFLQLLTPTMLLCSGNFPDVQDFISQTNLSHANFSQTYLTQPKFSQTYFFPNHLLHKPTLSQTNFYTNQLFPKPSFSQTYSFPNQLLHKQTFSQTNFIPNKLFPIQQFFPNQLFPKIFINFCSWPNCSARPTSPPSRTSSKSKWFAIF